MTLYLLKTWPFIQCSSSCESQALYINMSGTPAGHGPVYEEGLQFSSAQRRAGLVLLRRFSLLLTCAMINNPSQESARGQLPQCSHALGFEIIYISFFLFSAVCTKVLTYWINKTQVISNWSFCILNRMHGDMRSKRPKPCLTHGRSFIWRKSPLSPASATGMETLTPIWQCFSMLISMFDYIWRR